MQIAWAYLNPTENVWWKLKKNVHDKSFGDGLMSCYRSQRWCNEKQVVFSFFHYYITFSSELCNCILFTQFDLKSSCSWLQQYSICFVQCLLTKVNSEQEWIFHHFPEVLYYANFKFTELMSHNLHRHNKFNWGLIAIRHVWGCHQVLRGQANIAYVEYFCPQLKLKSWGSWRKLHGRFRGPWVFQDSECCQECFDLHGSTTWCGHQGQRL